MICIGNVAIKGFHVMIIFENPIFCRYLRWFIFRRTPCNGGSLMLWGCLSEIFSDLHQNFFGAILDPPDTEMDSRLRLCLYVCMYVCLYVCMSVCLLQSQNFDRPYLLGYYFKLNHINSVHTYGILVIACIVRISIFGFLWVLWRK